MRERGEEACKSSSKAPKHSSRPGNSSQRRSQYPAHSPTQPPTPTIMSRERGRSRSPVRGGGGRESRGRSEGERCSVLVRNLPLDARCAASAGAGGPVQRGAAHHRASCSNPGPQRGWNMPGQCCQGTCSSLAAPRACPARVPPPPRPSLPPPLPNTLASSSCSPLPLAAAGRRRSRPSLSAMVPSATSTFPRTFVSRAEECKLGQPSKPSLEQASAS